MNRPYRSRPVLLRILAAWAAEFEERKLCATRSALRRRSRRWLYSPGYFTIVRGIGESAGLVLRISRKSFYAKRTPAILHPQGLGEKTRRKRSSAGAPQEINLKNRRIGGKIGLH